MDDEGRRYGRARKEGEKVRMASRVRREKRRTIIVFCFLFSGTPLFYRKGPGVCGCVKSAKEQEGTK